MNPLFTNYAKTLALIPILFLISLPLSETAHNLMLKESGLIEISTAVGYGICAFLMLIWGKTYFIKQQPYTLFIVIAFMLRELDFDKRFTTMGILKSRFYLNTDVPVIEKIIGAAVILALAISVYYALKHHFKNLFDGLFFVDKTSVGIALIFSLLVFSKSIDGFGRKLLSFGIEVSPKVDFYVASIEEISELCIPILIMLVISNWYQRKTKEKLSNNFNTAQASANNA